MIVNLIFLLVSLLIYSGYGIAGLAYLLGAVVISWVAGLLTPRWRWSAVISVVLNAVSLLMLKLQPLTGIPWLSVMGMSYFTLQIMAYQIDVFRGKYPPERNFLRYALYVTWIPHLFMGPIERYEVMAPHLTAKRVIGWDGISRGALRILLGAVKKLVIAARLNVIISAISADTASYNGAFALAAMLLYSVQLYCDFSGGIDMVLGVSQMVGIPMSENFDRPYFSQSIREFWRRWHITLGAWLRDYVYIPLGGSRKGTWRKLLNTVVTFLVAWCAVSRVGFPERRFRLRWRPAENPEQDPQPHRNIFGDLAFVGIFRMAGYRYGAEDARECVYCPQLCCLCIRDWNSGADSRGLDRAGGSVAAALGL